MLFNIWIKRAIMPLGRTAIFKSLILSKIVLWMLLSNPLDSCIDNLQKMCFRFIQKRKQDLISRKTVIKSIKKGGLGLFDIWQVVNGLKLIWIHKFTNDNHKWKNIISAICLMWFDLACKLNLFLMHT